MNINKKSAAVMRAPLLAGDNIPNMANTERKSIHSWTHICWQTPTICARYSNHYMTMKHRKILFTESFNCLLLEKANRLDTSHNFLHFISLPITIMVAQKSCIPAPMRDARSLARCGGRNTSPWTSFQPVSSRMSSPSGSSWLYLAMSRRRVRTMIMVRIPRITDQVCTVM